MRRRSTDHSRASRKSSWAAAATTATTLTMVHETETLLGRERDGGSKNSVGAWWPRAAGRKTSWVLVVGGVVVGACGLAVAPWRGSNALIGDLWRPRDGHTFLAPAPGGNSGPFTFKLHSYCKTPEVRKKFSNFFLDGGIEAYVVKHDYGSRDFFKNGSALPMESVALSDIEVGYSLSSSDANFEFGFAYKNTLTNDWAYEIGEDGSPLAYQSCTQRYGKYFNRVLTLEDSNTIEYVFGSCNKTCDGYEDTMFTPRIVAGHVPNCPDSSMVIGKTDDARLVNIRSGMLTGGTYKAGLGRGLVSRDTQYEFEDENEAQYFLHGVSPYYNGGAGGGPVYNGQREVKIAAMKVVRNPANDDVSVCKASAKSWPFSSSCSGKNCFSGNLDLSTLWRSSSSTGADWGVAAPMFTVGFKGDNRPQQFSYAEPGSGLITEAVILSSAQMGHNHDVRRVILTSGSPCGSVNGCRRTLIAEPDTSVTPTATERYWILGVIGSGGSDGGPYINMVRVRVFLDASNNVRLRALGSCAELSNLVAANTNNRDRDAAYDIYRMPESMTAHWNDCDHTYSLNGQMGIGSVAFLLAGEMVPSLAENNGTTSLGVWS